MSKAEEAKLIEAVKNSPELVIECDLGPDKIETLIESHVQLVYQIFHNLNDCETISE